MSNWGFVYCLGNDAIPDLLKIGFTTRSPMQRAEELSRASGVPRDFEVYFYMEIQNPQEVETRIHRILNGYRLNGRREFFNVSDETVLELFERIEDQQGMIATSYAYESMRAVREYERTHPGPFKGMQIGTTGA